MRRVIVGTTAAAVVALAVSTALAAQPLVGQFLTGSSGGVFDVLGGGLANVINKNVERVRLNPSNPPSISVVPGELSSGRAVFGIAQIDQVYRAIEGTGEYKQPHPNVKVVMGLYDNVMSQVVLKDSPIKNIKEAEGLRVGVPSQTTKAIVARVYEMAGVPEDKINWMYLSYSEIASALKDGNIDIGTFTGYPKNGTVEALASTKGIRFLKVDDDVQKKWTKKNPLNAFRTIPAGTYPGVDEDGHFYAIFATLLTSSDVSEDNIYRIIKAIYNNQSAVAAVHPAGKQVTPQKTTEYIKGDIIKPEVLHPGAKKYFEEAGISLQPGS
jgi:TRAP transporter TAXI family solute receptor